MADVSLTEELIAAAVALGMGYRGGRLLSDLDYSNSEESRKALAEGDHPLLLGDRVSRAGMLAKTADRDRHFSLEP